jgi:hypothetical protein
MKFLRLSELEKPADTEFSLPEGMDETKKEKRFCNITVLFIPAAGNLPRELAGNGYEYAL